MEIHTSSNELERLSLSLLVGHSLSLFVVSEWSCFLFGFAFAARQLAMVCCRTETTMMMMVVACFAALGEGESRVRLSVGVTGLGAKVTRNLAGDFFFW